MLRLSPALLMPFKAYSKDFLVFIGFSIRTRRALLVLFKGLIKVGQSREAHRIAYLGYTHIRFEHLLRLTDSDVVYIFNSRRAGGLGK